MEIKITVWWRGEAELRAEGEQMDRMNKDSSSEVLTVLMTIGII